MKIGDRLRLRTSHTNYTLSRREEEEKRADEGNWRRATEKIKKAEKFLFFILSICVTKAGPSQLA